MATENIREVTDFSTVTTAAPMVIQFTNPYDKDADKETVWNTGLSATGFPHSNEDYTNKGKATIEEDWIWAAKHTVEVPLFKTNQKIILAPKDTVKISVTRADEALYYKDLAQSDMLTIEVVTG